MPMTENRTLKQFNSFLWDIDPNCIFLCILHTQVGNKVGKVGNKFNQTNGFDTRSGSL